MATKLCKKPINTNQTLFIGKLYKKSREKISRNIVEAYGHKVRVIKSTTVYVPSSELGLSHGPLSPASVLHCPSPRKQKGGGVHSPACEGMGESQFRRLEKSLSLWLLCGYCSPETHQEGAEDKQAGWRWHQVTPAIPPYIPPQLTVISSHMFSRCLCLALLIKV